MRNQTIVFGLIFSLLSAPAALAQAGSTPPPPPIRAEPFPDVPKDHWAFDAVEQLRKLGILRGYPAPPVSKSPTRKPAATRKPRSA